MTTMCGLSLWSWQRAAEELQRLNNIQAKSGQPLELNFRVSGFHKFILLLLLLLLLLLYTTSTSTSTTTTTPIATRAHTPTRTPTATSPTTTAANTTSTTNYYHDPRPCLR